MSTTNQAVDSRRRSTDGRLHRRGDARARAELTERYLPLACSLARRYRNCGEPLEDLVQVASLGLVMAIDRWEPERGLEFSSFAVPTILGQLRRHFRDHGWVVRPPRRTQELYLIVAKARRELWAELGRPPSVDQIAAYLDRTTRTYSTPSKPSPRTCQPHCRNRASDSLPSQPGWTSRPCRRPAMPAWRTGSSSMR